MEQNEKTNADDNRNNGVQMQGRFCNFKTSQAQPQKKNYARVKKKLEQKIN